MKLKTLSTADTLLLYHAVTHQQSTRDCFITLYLISSQHATVLSRFTSSAVNTLLFYHTLPHQQSTRYCFITLYLISSQHATVLPRIIKLSLLACSMGPKMFPSCDP